MTLMKGIKLGILFIFSLRCDSPCLSPIVHLEQKSYFLKKQGGEKTLHPVDIYTNRISDYFSMSIFLLKFRSPAVMV